MKGYVDVVLIVGQHVDEALTFSSANGPNSASDITALSTVIAGRIAAV